MSEDTPRTNAHMNQIGESGVDWHHSATLMSNFAKCLECELSESNDKWKRYSDLYDTAEAANAENIKTIARLTADNAALREELKRKDEEATHSGIERDLNT